ncbi:MAG TPA: hemerythrin domain-containing protein [Candidatus Methylomirabilis sp.]|nr:hemerythrin domain-containing protein [Candidatus Methylomirabilis sp.]
MSPTGLLEAEHRIIRRVVNTMLLLAAALERDGDVESTTWPKIVDFMRTFAEQVHHGKEEGHLFPILKRKGVPVAGYPLEALIRDHEKTQALTQELAEATETYLRGGIGAKANLIRSLRGLIDLYPNHMWKEEYLLFPMANRLMSPRQQRDLRERFAATDAAIGADAYRQFEQLADQLADQVGGFNRHAPRDDVWLP